MNGIFRKPVGADATGDAIPFFHDGMYHIFSLTPPAGTTVYPDRLRTTWSHTVSRDLWNWEELPTALCPGMGSEPDADGIWTGSVIFGKGLYHIFYTGYNYHTKTQQTICHATSEDGISWMKDPDNPILVPLTDLYRPLDWRDPYIFFNKDDGCYWLLVSARLRKGPSSKSGCIVLFRSDDLSHWVPYGPIYTPYHTNCPECSEMYKLKDTWYLSYSRFSEHVETIYRMADSPFGPWRTPRIDGIGGRRFYAAKSCINSEGRCIYFGWVHDRADGRDDGEWYWGGDFCVPHEVIPNSYRELDVKMPYEIESGLSARVLPWSLVPRLGQVTSAGNKSISINSPGSFGYSLLKIHEKTFLFRCRVRISYCRDNFGILFKTDADANQCLELRFEIGMQRASLLSLPMDVDPFWRKSCTDVGSPAVPGPDGNRVAEKHFTVVDGSTFEISALVDHDLVEIFVGEKIAFTYRIYRQVDYQMGLFVRDGLVDFTNIRITGCE